jgi:hypothetical protein
MKGRGGGGYNTRQWKRAMMTMTGGDDGGVDAVGGVGRWMTAMQVMRLMRVVMLL